MRIGIDLRCLASGRRSGVEEYAVGLLSALFRTDSENDYILFLNEWHREAIDLSWAEGFSNVSIRKFRIPNKLLNLSLWYLRYPKLDRLIGGVDAYFMPNINFCAVSAEAKLFVTAHDLSFRICPETFSWKQRMWHAFVDPKGLFKRAYRVIAVSKSTRDDLVFRYGIESEKITVVPSGIDARFHAYDRNDPKMSAVKEKYELPYSFILFLGAFEPRKNIDAIVRAYNALRRAKHPELEKTALVLAGVSGWKGGVISREVEHSPYRGNIILTGFVEDADKPAFFNLASAFVYPSVYEGFGFPALEALACGAPVIASNSSSLPEVVGDAGVLVDPHRPDEIFRALESVLLDRKFRTTLRERGIARSKTFSWDAAAKRVSRLFDTAASPEVSDVLG
ncbi:MAG: glycosyltransferase family 4 protein [Candidatus Moranbacteria bacterium]|nr:glycosyltransferase family 4 protein [Candidatus Moranbacteria bacterium]